MRDYKPRRIVAAAMFQGEIGPVTARELVDMPEAQWGILKDRVTDYRSKRPAGLLATCLMCNDPVFIRARRMNGKPLPLFSHFQGGGADCEWHYGSNENPKHIRAEQYRGRQASAVHDHLCRCIDNMARLDSRYISSTVEAYLPPTESEHGRFPDVAVKWRDFSDFVIEVQLSRTFQTEISARCTHYEREGVALIWVLYGFEPDIGIPQSFVDVVRRHRGNAFVIDQEAISASNERKTIVLKCYLQDDLGGFGTSRLVTLDDLTFPPDRLPYLEDRITKALLAKISAKRRPYLAFFEAIKDVEHWIEKDNPQRRTLIATLRALTPDLSIWASTVEDEENAVLRLLAAIFSIVSTANGKPRNYATMHPNVSAMLNTWLNAREDFQRYAAIIEFLLRRTPLESLLKGTVGKHIDRAKQRLDGNLCIVGEPEWLILRDLMPEIFDSGIRAQLRYLSSLPTWALSATD